jgi:Ras family protein
MLTSTGKTSLTQQFVAPPTYVEGYFPTVEATTHKTITHAGIEYDCELIDSAGQVRVIHDNECLRCGRRLTNQDEYTLFPSKYANGVHGYLLVYSINSRQSFEMIQTIYDKITDFSGAQNMPTVIVGQKNDLATEQRYVYFLLCFCGDKAD